MKKYIRVEGLLISTSILGGTYTFLASKKSIAKFLFSMRGKQFKLEEMKDYFFIEKQMGFQIFRWPMKGKNKEILFCVDFFSKKNLRIKVKRLY